MSRLKTRGSGNAAAKLNEPLVASIKVALGLGMQQRLLARAVGISETQMHRIKTGECWAHVKPDPSDYLPLN